MKNCTLLQTALLYLALSVPFFGLAQAPNNLWTDVLEQDIPSSGTRIIKPTEYRTAQLDLNALDDILFTAPQEVVGEAINSNVVLAIPNPDGGMSEFKVYYSPIMEQPLADMFPEIRTYGGYDDEGNYVRLDHTPQGFHAMVLPVDGDSWFIDPYTFGNIDPEYYVIYKRKFHARAIEEELQCYTESDSILDRDDIFGTNSRYADCQHRNYRLAISATGEYTIFHGGTVALAQAAQVTTMNRVNGIFERDLAIRMTFIANNNLIIYTDPATDPFSNGNTGAMINENQTVTDAVIGAANYDIGHIFGTNSGGLAQLYSPCSGNKARGVTGSGAPIGDPFDVDYVAHEMGHQYGAQHTQNNNCNRTAATSMEPGSAATIMGYAGICAPNVQNNSDDYFHAISLQEMGNFITSAGHTCPTETALANDPPTVTATNGNITVPASTPFALTATAIDPNGDPILYCWEQMDPTWATMPPTPTNTDGPNFRSFDPSLSPTRHFPNLADLSAGNPTTWEVLSSVSRAMPFRVSIRDYAPGGGCTDHEDITVTIDATSGPFVVTVPSNTGITWGGNTNETVTWNVAGTNAGAVACANVDIFLSTDGGLTYPTQLADNVANDGSETILVPNTATTTARIMVICEDGTFFDISDNNFTITAATFDYTLGVTSSSASACQPNNAIYTVNVGSIGGYTDPVTLSVSGVPSGAIASFGTSPINPGNSTTLTISNTGAATPGVYSLVLQGNSTSGIKTENLTLTINAGTPAATTNSTPANGATNVAIPTTLTWAASASSPVTYTVDVATDAAFSSIVQTTSNIATTSLAVTGLATSTTYYWRVRVDNACASSTYSPTFTFTTNNCGTFASADVPVSISASGTPTVTSTLSIGTAGSITDLNVLGLDIPHTYVSDLTITLTSPQGTVVTLMDGICGGNDNIDLNFDDSGTAHASIPCPPVGGGTFQPNDALSAFNGEDQLGTWILTVSDAFNADGGSIDAWSLEICAISNDYTLSTNPTTVTECAGNNAVYTVDIGSIGGYSDPVTLSVAGLPAGATGTFSTNPVLPGNSTTLTISNTAGVTPGSSIFTLNATSTSGNQAENLTLDVLSASPGLASLLSPSNGATNVATAPTLTWGASTTSGVTYTVQIATDAAFSSIVQTTSGISATSLLVTGLSTSTQYYWRVRTDNVCGSSAFTLAFNFTTGTCVSYASTDVPVAISSSGTPTETSTLSIGTSGTITDLNVLNLDIPHTYVSDLTITLTSPQGTVVTLMDGLCGGNDNININFDDAGAAYGSIPCPPVGGGTFQPNEALSAFNGEDPLGTWTLTVSDAFNADGGSIDGWTLEVCADPPCTNAGTPSLSLSANPVCPGGSATLTVSGSLNDATAWEVYTATNGGGTNVGSTTSTISLSSTGATAFYVRGEGGCTTPGTEASITLNGIDNTDPTISCPGNDLVVLNGSCQVSLSDYTGAATANDDCDASPTVSQSPTPGTIISGHGTTQTVTLTATDASANSANCTFTVLLDDDTDPVVTCPSITEINPTANCGMPDLSSGVSVSDNCDINPVITSQSPAVGSDISTLVGTNQNLTFTATDVGGNTGTCTVNLPIIDNTNPTISCPSNTNETADVNCQVSLPDYTGAATISDNCDSSPVVSQSPAPSTVLIGLGTVQTVTLTVQDASSNTAQCSFNVTVSSSAPAQPTSISGMNPACPNSSQTYSVPAVVGALSYTWTIPSGWTGTSTSNSITVTTGSTGGTIFVAAENGCGQTGTAQSQGVSIISIDDGVPCTLDACDPTTGAVTHTPNDAICDDGIWCNGQETCDAILGCQSGTPPVLDDGNSCTDDSCDEANDQVIHINNSDPCDDGNPFTINDQCVNGACVGTPIGNVWTGNINTTWGLAGNWMVGVPSSTDDAIIPTTPTGGVFPEIPSGYFADVDNIEIQSGASVTVLGNGTLDVFGVLTNDGTVNVNNNGSLLQRVGSTLSGSGIYNVQRQGNTGQNFDYWSSPITSQVGVPGASYLYNSNASTQDDSDDSPSDPGWTAYNGSMTQGVGYAGNGGGLFTFSGTVGNGTVSVPLVYHPFDNTYTQTTPGTPFNLVGNPYPSAVSAAQFVADNPGISGTLYFWDDDLSGGTGYHRTDYAYWNGTGGLGTGPGTIGVPNGSIATAQGFMVRALSGGVNLDFNNGQRIAGSNSQFFRMANQEGRLWFSIEKDSAFNQILIGMIEDATFGEDRLYDAVKMHTANEVSIAAMSNATEHAIMAFPHPEGGYTVPLLVTVSEDGYYDFRANTMEDFGDYQVEFSDVSSNLNVPLQEGTSVTLHLNAGEHEDRFFLNFMQNAITGIDESSDYELLAWVGNDHLLLSNSSSREFEGNIDLFNTLGENVLTIDKVKLGNGLTTIQLPKLATGVYIVRFSDQKAVISKKVLVE